MGVEVVKIEQQRPNLGRHLVHDSRSLAFPAIAAIDRSKWRTKSIRIYDPKVNPSQCHGECTGVAKSIQMNAVGNRKAGVVFNMNTAHNVYQLATKLDPFDGEWPPDDTGSSGLASAKAAQKMGIGGEYRHVFNGADEVVQLIQDGFVVSVGTEWHDDMFTPDLHRIIAPTGPVVGGHQYAARGYDAKRDLVLIRCWWGSFQDVYIRREHLNHLILDGGDAHIQTRI